MTHASKDIQTTPRLSRARKGKISDTERLRRENAVRFARANVELEGFKLTEEYLAQLQNFADGHISLDQLMQFVDVHAKRK